MSNNVRLQEADPERRFRLNAARILAPYSDPLPETKTELQQHVMVLGDDGVQKRFRGHPFLVEPGMRSGRHHHDPRKCGQGTFAGRNMQLADGEVNGCHVFLVHVGRATARVSATEPS